MKRLSIFIGLFLFAATLAFPARSLPGAEIGRGVQLTWLGQSGFKIVSPKGTIILVDPWARGNSLYPYKTPDGNPDLSPLLGADMILVTHGHLDHLGDTLEIAKEATKKDIKVVCILELMTYLWQEGADQNKLQAMNIGGTVKIKDVEITMLRAVHSSGIGSFSPKSLTYGGEATGFLIEFSNGFRIYDAGDTALFGEMKSYNTFYHPNLFLVPIGGLYTMGPKEAAMATDFVHPQVVIPMHYGGTFNLPGTPEEFKSALSKKIRGVRVIVPVPGKTIE